MAAGKNVFYMLFTKQQTKINLMQKNYLPL
jgi:hypothetical protein